MRLLSKDTASLVLALTLFASVVAHAGVHYSLGVLAKEQALAEARRAREAASRRNQRRVELEFELSGDDPSSEARASTNVDPSVAPHSDSEAPAEQAESEDALRERLRARRLARIRQQRGAEAVAAALATLTPPESEADPEPEREREPPPPPRQPTPPRTPTPPPEERIAVRQHSENPEEPPPETVYIADENNTVEEETVAEITNLDRDDVETSVGAALQPPSETLEDEGNANDEALAESEDVDGSSERRPTPEEVTRRPRPRPNRETRAEGRTMAADALADSRAERTPGGDGATGAAARRQAGVRARAGGGDPNAGGAAALLAAAQGDWTLRMDGSLGAGGGDGAGGVPVPSREALEGVPRGTARGRAERGRRPGERTGRPGPELNLRYSQLVDVVGEQRLAEEREAHFAEQRSRIRGTPSGANWQQFRAALENYMPSVRPGAQTALNAARSPFATYVARIHDRVHNTYHGFVDNLPRDTSGPFADPNLRTLLEIVLNRDGTVHRVGVVRSSGLSMFDYGAYNAVRRGQPYPVAPDEILSGDGRVYMHWDFHRQQPYCHQSHARPYILPHIGGGQQIESPVDQLQDTTLVPSDARVTFGVEGEAEALEDEEADDEPDEDEEVEEEEQREEQRDQAGDADAEAVPRPTTTRRRGPRL